MVSGWILKFKYLFLPALKPAAEAEAGANIRRVGNR